MFFFFFFLCIISLVESTTTPKLTGAVSCQLCSRVVVVVVLFQRLKLQILLISASLQILTSVSKCLFLRLQPVQTFLTGLFVSFKEKKYFKRTKWMNKFTVMEIFAVLFTQKWWRNVYLVDCRCRGTKAHETTRDPHTSVTCSTVFKSWGEFVNVSACCWSSF